MKYDPEVVRRLIAGTMRVKDVCADDRDAAILELTDRGLDPGTVGTALGCNSNTVMRAVERAAAKAARVAALAVNA